MEYNEARKYIKEASKKGSILGLESIKNLMDKLSNVQDKIKIIHVAGTNGKGSTITYIESILRELGYKVGKYMSPGVFEYREIFTVDGEMIDENTYGKLMGEIAATVDQLVKEGKEAPTAFELETALAFLYFYRENCDVALIETGMGGDMDATNIIKRSEVSVLTPVSIDHSAFLGNSIKEIAGHKAGIIKKNSKVVAARQTETAMDIFRERANKLNSKFIGCGDVLNMDFRRDYTDFSYIAVNTVKYDLRTYMLGSFQPMNAATAIETVLAFLNCEKEPDKEQYKEINEEINEEAKEETYKETNEEAKEETYKEINEEANEEINKENYMKSDLTKHIEAGIKNARIKGRFENIKLDSGIEIIMDGGHNPGASVELNKTLGQYFKSNKAIFLVGMLADKDCDAVMKNLCSYAEIVITITPDNLRAMKADKLAELAGAYCERVYSQDSYEDGLNLALKFAKEKNENIYIGGSLSFLGDMRRIIEKQR